MKRELIAKDKEIEVLKIIIEKKDKIIESLRTQFDGKCIEMIHLRKDYYKLKKEKQNRISLKITPLMKYGEKK